jgi:predicted transcriptional regulator
LTGVLVQEYSGCGSLNSLVLKEPTLARKKSQDLTEAELRLMDVIWRKGSATVAEVAEALPKQLGLAYNTVLTTMRILEDKGYVRHTKSKEGRAFLYHPVVGQKEASRNAVRRLLTRFFRDSPEELVLNLLEDEELSEQELTRIRKRISEEVIKGAEGAK